MVYQAHYLIIAFFLSSASSLSQQQHNSHISFGSVLRSSGGIFNNENAGNTNNDNDNDDAINQGWQHWCDPCACGFNKIKSYKQHVSGKRHGAVIAESDGLWEGYLKSGPVFYDPSVDRKDVTRAWSLDLFMDGLEARSRSSIKQVLVVGVPGGQLDPSLMLHDLSPKKRAALWRFLYSSAVPRLASMVAELPPHYARVKELLESIETFGHVERLMKRSTVQGQKATKVLNIYDVGCGHGLVGMLCAARFPSVKVHSIDLVPRASFQAQREAFRLSGTVLNNLTFEAGDLSVLYDLDDGSIEDNSQNSLLLCVHGCKSLTHESIELAERNKWSWLSLPCCLQSEHHLDEKTTLKVADETRFAMLCGAIASKYRPQTVTSIDSRITARGIVLASSGKR